MGGATKLVTVVSVTSFTMHGRDFHKVCHNLHIVALTAMVSLPCCFSNSLNLCCFPLCIPMVTYFGLSRICR